ncbi:MAG: hypothetical protein EXQ74_02020 [Thermoleophilia bacterium]|nr:hypothetical protein [Thermoleophilia bacterium]
MGYLTTPPVHAWIVPGSLAIAERPGGGGRSHRVARREADLAWWHAQGVRTIVSAMRSRHGLVEYAQAGYHVRWHPLRDVAQARAAIPLLADDVATVLAGNDGALLVHCDRVSEWLAAIDATLRIRLDRAGDVRQALEQAAADGLPVGDLARDLMDTGSDPATA